MAGVYNRGVLLKGLPFNSLEQDIKLFLKPLEIPDEHIHMIKFRDGKGTGLCYVKLLDEDQIQRALLKDKNHIGQRYIEVTPATEEQLYSLQLAARSGDLTAREMYQVCNDSTRRRSYRERSPVTMGMQTKCAYVSGIPAGHHYKELRLFFAGILIGRNCIHLMRDGDSTIFRGDAYVQFGSVEECRKGLALSGTKLAGSTVIIEPCTMDEFEENVYAEEQKGSRNNWESDHRRDYRRGGRGDRTPSPVRRRQEAYKARYDDQPEYYTANYRDRETRYRDTIAMHAYGGEASFFGSPHEPLHHDRLPAESYSVDQYSGRTPHVHHPPAVLRDDYLPPSGSYISPRQHNYHHHESPAIKEEGRYPTSYGSSSVGSAPPLEPLPGVVHYAQDHQGPTQAAAERRVVRVEGLPYDVSVHDIVAFFQNYSVNFDQVRIQCRDDGSPSGKAFVNFPSEKFARTAIEGCNRRYIGKRFVELFLV